MYMELNFIKNWFIELLNKKFNIKSESINKLSSLDLFYLYVEIYKNFNVKLTIEEITDDNLSLDSLSRYIYSKINNGIC